MTTEDRRARASEALIFLLRLRGLGVELEARGDSLAYQPVAAMTADLLLLLRAHKEMLLELLRPGSLWRSLDTWTAEPTCQTCPERRFWLPRRGWLCVHCSPPGNPADVDVRLEFGPEAEPEPEEQG